MSLVLKNTTFKVDPMLVPTTDKLQTPVNDEIKISIPKKADIAVDLTQQRINLTEAVNHFNEVLRDGGRGLSFSIDDQLETPVIIVKNEETGEVIRQIPNEVIIRMAHSIEKLKGLLHNKNA
jgi:flagellar protein FlaG